MVNYAQAAASIKQSVLRDCAIELEKSMASLPIGRSRVGRNIVTKILANANTITSITRDELYNEIRLRKKKGITGARATTNTSIAAEALIQLLHSPPKLTASTPDSTAPKKRKKGGNTLGNTRQKRRHLKPN